MLNLLPPNWQLGLRQYLSRFEGSIPLVISPKHPYPQKCKVRLIESEIDLNGEFFSLEKFQPEAEYKIIAGIKAKLEDFIQFDWLCGSKNMPYLFSKYLADKIKNICLSDITCLPVTIINLSDKVVPYVNKDFYLINVLNTLDALDKKTQLYDIILVKIYTGLIKEFINPILGRVIL